MDCLHVRSWDASRNLQGGGTIVIGPFVCFELFAASSRCLVLDSSKLPCVGRLKNRAFAALSCVIRYL